MDVETVAGLFSISPRQVLTYCNLGMPFEKRGRERVIPWPKALEWYVVYKSGGVIQPDVDLTPADDTDEPGPGKKENLTQANLRKTRAEADLKQLVLAQKRGQVINIAEARVILDRMLGNLKSALLGAAPLLNTRLEGEEDGIAREAAIRDFMENLCRELATGKIVRDAIAEAPAPDEEVDEPEDETIDGLEASAEDVTDEELNAIVVEYLAAHAALQKAQQA